MGLESSSEELPPGWKQKVQVYATGRKVKIYVEQKTGCKFYSKTRVMKYLESVSSDSRPVNQKHDAPQDRLPMLDKSIITGENNNLLDEISIEEVSADKHLIQDAPTNRQPQVDNSMISGIDDKDILKMSSEVVDRSPVLEGFPPGWVRENRPRKKNPKIVDPYYIDPISGYEFLSKLDVRRYLETGDIGTCKIIPKKGRLKFEDDTSMIDCLNMDPIAIDYHGAISSSPTAVLRSSNLLEAKKSKERETLSISANSKSTAVDANEDTNLISEVIECHGSEHNSEANIEGSELSAKLNDERALSITSSADFKDYKPVKDQLDIKTLTNLKQSKRKAQNIPARSSRRLSRQEPEIQPMMVSNGRNLQAACKKSALKEASTSVKEQKASANVLLHQLDIYQQIELPADPSLSCKVASLQTEIQNKIEKPLVCQSVPEQADLVSACNIASPQTEMRNNNDKPLLGQDVPDRAVALANEKSKEENLGTQVSHVWYPFGDSLSDPCYEFAFKTLTGEIPLEETLAFHNIFQQPVVGSFTQRGLSVGLTEIDTTPWFQNEVPYQPDPVQNNLSAVQLPSNPNINLASCTSFGGQQASLEARSKDYKTKVNS